MNSFTLPVADKYQPPLLFIFHFLFLPIVSFLLIFIYFDNQTIINIILVSTVLIYALIISTLGCLGLKSTKPVNTLISLLGIVIGAAYIMHAFYSLFLYSNSHFMLTVGRYVAYINAIRPYFISIGILFICKIFDTEFNKKLLIYHFITFVIVLSVVGFAMQSRHSFEYLVYHNACFYDFLGIGGLILIFLLTTSLLVRRLKSIPIPIFVSITLIIILVTIGELLNMLSDSILIRILSYSIIIIALCILYSVQLQLGIVYPYELLCKKRHLYFMNTSITNEHLKFKDLEFQSLRYIHDEKEKFYTRALDFAPDAFLISIGREIIYANHTLLELLKLPSKDDILSKSLWDFMHPDCIPLSKIKHKILSTSESAPLVNEFKLIASDGQIKQVEISSNSTLFDNKYYIISCIRDLSNIKEQERIASELEANISREKFKVEFFANISHDLKTPINIIYSAAQLQDMGFTSNDLEKGPMYNNIIKQNCLRLQKLLNDLLDITKIDTNHFVPRHSACDIVYLIEGITDSVTAYVEHKNLSIIFDTNVEEGITMTDPNLIERVVLNLLSNAIKYGKPNGHIWVTLNIEDDFLQISIKDDGIGIPKEQLPIIFERFSQAKNNKLKNTDSSGIGLSLVRAIIEMLDGSITCKSEEGIGSEFIIKLPMLEYDIDSYIDYEYATALERTNTLNVELSNL